MAITCETGPMTQEGRNVPRRPLSFGPEDLEAHGGTSPGPAELTEVAHQSAAVLLGADGLLAGGPVSGIEEVREFVGAIAEALAESAADQPLADATEPELTSGAPRVIGGELVSEDR